MKRIIFGLIVVLSIGLIATSCGNRKKTDKNETEMTETKVYEPEFDIVTNFGTMRVKLYDKTPLHRDNFVKLVNEKFYDGIRFHRVIEGFMIQTGDPYSRDLDLVHQWGTGGTDYTIPAEFVNQYYHKKGALAAARKGDMVAMVAVDKAFVESLDKIKVNILLTTPLLDKSIEQGTIIDLVECVAYIRIYDGGLRFAEAVGIYSDADLMATLERLNEVFGIYNMYARAKGDTERILSVCQKSFKYIEK